LKKIFLRKIAFLDYLVCLTRQENLDIDNDGGNQNNLGTYPHNEDEMNFRRKDTTDDFDNILTLF